MIINHDFGCAPRKTRQGADTKSLGLILYIGLNDTHEYIQHHTQTRKFASLACASFMSMSMTNFIKLSPSLVLTPLVSGTLDVLDFAQKLNSLSFSGRYRAVVHKLPNAMMVSREVHDVAPSINFAVTELLGSPKDDVSLSGIQHGRTDPTNV